MNVSIVGPIGRGTNIDAFAFDDDLDKEGLCEVKMESEDCYYTYRAKIDSNAAVEIVAHLVKVFGLETGR